MSIIVKGMEMPESCGACKLSVQVSMSLGAVMRCRLLGVVGTSAVDPHDVLNKRHPNCPLVELPEKHGRLIDADELIETAEFYETEMDIKNHSKTVIEAEGDE